MKQLAPPLVEAMLKAMREHRIPESQRVDYLKWLRFYLDFCLKYRCAPRDKDSLGPFLQKLTEKSQPTPLQEQAAASISLYHKLMTTWAKSEQANPQQEMARAPWDALYSQLKAEISTRQYSPKTFTTYATWTRQFQAFLTDKPPTTITDDDARRFLTHLAVEKRVVASTQNQAFNALLFLYRHILKSRYELGDSVVRARRTRFIPVVLSREEIDSVVDALDTPYNLAVQLLYGCGLRLSECLSLRVQCLNFDEAILTVHNGKGRKVRTVPLPRALIPALKEQLDLVATLHEQDMAAGYDGVFMPGALDRKWKNASREFIWQWLFPARMLTLVPQDGERRRYHLHDSEIQKALRHAVRKVRIPKRVTCHTFRHSFASHLLRANYDIRTIQQLLGHSDVRTTMLYTHTVKSRTLKEMTSPLDFTPSQLASAV